MSFVDAYDLTIEDGYYTPGRRKNNWQSSNTPTAAHGSNFRFEIGSHWVNGSNIWICTTSTTGSSTWTRIDDDSDTLAIDLSVSGNHAIDRTVAATHDLTLTGNATFTLAGAATGRATDIRLLLRPDGNTATWPGNVTWVGGSAPDQSADLLTIGFLTVDDGTTWLGFFDQVGSSSGASEDHTHAGYAGELLIADEPAGTPLIFADLLQNEAQDDLIYADT